MDESIRASKPAKPPAASRDGSGPVMGPALAFAIVLLGFFTAQSETAKARGKAPGPSVDAPPAQEPPPKKDSIPEPGADGADGAAGDDTSGSEAEVAAAEEEEEEDGESPQPLWMDTYGEGVYSRHDNRNLSGFTEFKLGKRVNLGIPTDFYLKTRLYRDQRDFFWNNRADVGLGARIPLLKKVSLQLFGEVIGGQYLRLSSGTLGSEGMQARIEKNRAAINVAQGEFQAMYKEIFEANLINDRNVDRKTISRLDTTGNTHLATLSRLNDHLDSLETSQDSMASVMDSLALIPAGSLREYRAGLIFWYGWGQDAAGQEAPRPRVSFPARLWGEIYSDWIFSSLGRHVRTRGPDDIYRDSVARFNNLIFYANPAAGMMVMEGIAGSLAAYATGYVWFDTHKDWWNNLAMAGPGLRYKPLPMLDLVFKAEYLFGRYYGRERPEDPNPYDANLQDLRITGSFWYGMGI
jgi:hypothetical protein